MSPHPRFKARCLALAWALLSLAACGNEDQFYECGTQGECGSGQVCCYNEGGSECATATSCEAPPPQDPPEPTPAPSDPEPTETPATGSCSEAQPTTGGCLTPCRDQGDCGEGLVCTREDCLCVFI